MLSYRHAYHAGNFADVLKHAVLTRVIAALKKKATPFCYVDTHAGCARYDLHAALANKTREYLTGIGRLWQRDDAPRALDDYLDAVRAENPDGELNFYPGSPRIARRLLRDGDRMVLMELHTTEYPLLKQEFAHDRAVAVHHMNGYEGLGAWLPPKEKRGVVLIDPSYENRNEFDRVAEALQSAYARWTTGVLCLWYPVLQRSRVRQLESALRESGMRDVLVAELNVMPDDSPPGMHGCGMIVVRPPYQLDAELKQIVPWLRDALVQQQPAPARVEWLVPE
jgi:23S rRNA (adenine2030-N6)-methyltransferase